MARSINQNIPGQLLPSFRNMGTVLRIVLLVNGIALFSIASQATSLAHLNDSVLQGAALLEPVLLTSLLLLYAFDGVLARMVFWPSAVAVAGMVVAVTLLIDISGGTLFSAEGDEGIFHYARHVVLACTLALILVGYFRLRAQALTPARQGARLQALQARIRPHFLFNTLNAVLGIVRADPKRAETALEDMADLFRMAMNEPHELVGLTREIQLARQYLALEQMRIGDRLQVNWNIGELPGDALIPPLVLQPLLENAVYHGIEPRTAGGKIEVRIFREGKDLHVMISNPLPVGETGSTQGNKMALSNIRERLSLLFDVEAEYRVERSNETYCVNIRIPYQREQSDE